MKIRRYYVDNMREGMGQIRDELGPEALIVSTRRVRRKGWRGLFGPRRLEIIAAVDTPARDEQGDQRVIAELEELKVLVRHLLAQEKTVDSKETDNAALERWRRRLQEQDLDAALTKEIFDGISRNLGNEVRFTDEIAALILERQLRRYINVAPEKEHSLHVFVGPTGVGKTTTLAKLAARYAFFHGDKVGLLTIDHYRIGAVSQLKTYAEIADLPFQAVMSPADMPAAFSRLSHCDRILVDTAGRGTGSSVQIAELAHYLQGLPDAEIFLVISATTKYQDIKLIADSFQRLRYNRLIFTKIDETDSYGVLLNGMWLTGLPAVYLTDGQNVPDDLHLADEDKILSLVMGVKSSD